MAEEKAQDRERNEEYYSQLAEKYQRSGDKDKAAAARVLADKVRHDEAAKRMDEERAKAVDALGEEA